MFSKPPLNVLRTQKLPKHTSKAPQPLKNTKKGETIFATCSPSWAPFWHPQTSPKTIARLQKSFKAFFHRTSHWCSVFPLGKPAQVLSLWHLPAESTLAYRAYLHSTFLPPAEDFQPEKGGFVPLGSSNRHLQNERACP